MKSVYASYTAWDSILTIWPVGFLGFDVRITEVPRAISSAILSGDMWYWSASPRGTGIAAMLRKSDNISLYAV